MPIRRGRKSRGPRLFSRSDDTRPDATKRLVLGIDVPEGRATVALIVPAQRLAGAAGVAIHRYIAKPLKREVRLKGLHSSASKSVFGSLLGRAQVLRVEVAFAVQDF